MSFKMVTELQLFHTIGAHPGGTPKLHKDGKNVVCMYPEAPRFST